MPSPIAHTIVGYAVYRISTTIYNDSDDSAKVRLISRPLLAMVGLSLLPDTDIIPGILKGDIDGFHNNISHSLAFGLFIALFIGFGAGLKNRSYSFYWFGLALLGYELHVLMDFFTVGRGVMLFWPFSPERYEPALKLFYGLHRSDGLLSIRHLWTFLTEMGFVVIVIFVTNYVVYRVSKNEVPKWQ